MKAVKPSIYEECDMRFENSILSIFAGTALVTGIMLATTVQARDMEVNDIAQGGIEVRFHNGCYVTYDRYGNRGEQGRDCKNKQLELADETARSRYGSHSNSSSNSSANSVPEGQMSRYCMGEASAELNENPRYIATQPAVRSGNRYVVIGQTPESGSNVTTFECTFDHNGVFRGVEVTGRPHHGGNSGSNDEIPYAAKNKCQEMMGGSVNFGTISALRPGYWEVIMNQSNGSRSVACTVTSNGEIEDWVELN